MYVALLMLPVCKLLKIDLFTAGVASLANIGGTASALATLCANIMKALV